MVDTVRVLLCFLDVWYCLFFHAGSNPDGKALIQYKDVILPVHEILL